LQVRIFNIPVSDDGTLTNAMNSFLSNHRVLEIEQHFYNGVEGFCWSFCVRYLNTLSGTKTQQQIKPKVDYKLVLTEPEFAVFSKLRECRKEIAANDSVPAYAVFTDEELSGIAKLPVLEAEKLISIKGIGDKKVEKYGHQLINMYKSKIEKDEKGK